MTGISRRDLLKQLALGGAMAAVPASLLLEPGRKAVRPFALRLARVFSNAGSAQLIGQRYLASMPQEADPIVLAGRIAGSLPQYLRLSTAGTGRLRALLAVQQKQDFADGRMVHIDGWILSLTEARLCALAALSRSQAG